MKNHLYYYLANVIDVYDGDTIRVDVDLGMKTWVKNERIRLARINAPELRGEEREKGLISRDFLRSQILNKEVMLETFKDKEGKYGRYLAEVWVESNGEWINVNDMMVSEGMAVYHEY
ncbi:MAG: hypothetical protein Kow0042_15410 [Calditrichia bacterium]